jgi:hypothetical protein
MEERQEGQGRDLADIRAELRGLKWTLAGVSAVSAALGALAGVLANGGIT